MSWRTSASTPLTLLTADREPNLVAGTRLRSADPDTPPTAPFCIDSDLRSIGSGGRRTTRGLDSALVCGVLVGKPIVS